MTDLTAVSLNGLLRRRSDAQLLREPARQRPPQQPGARSSRRLGPGMDFAELRPYQPGDDVRHIDWRVTARHRTPHTKVFHQEHQRCWLILCDLRPSQYFASQGVYKSVLSAHLTALLCWSALAAGERVGGLIRRGQQWQPFQPSQQRAAVLPLFRALVDTHADLPQQPEELPGTINSGLQQLRRLAPKGSRLFLISDFLDLEDESHAHLLALSAHCDVIAMIPEDPLERESPPPGHYRFRDSHGEHVLNTQPDRVRAAIDNHLRNRRVELSRRLSRARISEQRISTNDDLKRRMAEWLFWS